MILVHQIPINIVDTMYKKTQDIISDRKVNSTALNTRVTPEHRTRALNMNSHLKEMENLSRVIKSMSYTDILQEYDAASDELMAANEAIQSISSEIQALALQLKQVTEKQELSTIRIAAIAEALRNHEAPTKKQETKEEKKSVNTPKEVEVETVNEKPKRPMDNEYLEILTFSCGSKKQALQTMRDEGYDVRGC